MGKLEKKTKEEKELKKNPAAYMKKLRDKSPTKARSSKPKAVHFQLPDI